MQPNPVMSAVCLATCIATAASAEMVPHTRRWNVELHSLPPSQVLAKLDLDRPGLEAVQAAAARGDQPAAMTELLRYYREKYPLSSADSARKEANFQAADRICRHIFQWGPYEPHDYGPEIDWASDPADDIEWVASMYRFHWATDLSRAYLATRDDRYARAFVELTLDWINKHPLNEWARTHPKYTYWKGFAWLDIQTGIRASRATTAFKNLVHSDAFTPEFLAVFLASMYDHQHKTERVPMGMIHNKAIFELQGVLDICHTFPEFSETKRWAKLAIEQAGENLLAQTTTDGVQREWCGGYHLAVLRDAIQMMEQASRLGVPPSDEYRQRVRRMCDYVFAVATPDLGWPMFGDTARPHPSPEREAAQLYPYLLRYSRLWEDPKYAARARLDRNALPEQTSYAFKEAGVYVMRSQWGPEGIYLALHCPPPAISGHDTPDNGTFELYAYGQWLLTDSGFYTYGHDLKARAWHRQTRVHQTLTLDGKDSKIDGRFRLWHTSPDLEALVVENPSYNGLTHRRTVWFVDKTFFVFLDEAMPDEKANEQTGSGTEAGTLRVHWTPMPGEGRISPDGRTFTTQFPDANVLIHAANPSGARLYPEDGWFAWTYGHRTPRTALSVKHPDAAPAAFLTIVVPYRGTTPPEVEASLLAADTARASTGDDKIGGDVAHVSVQAFGKHWRIGRDLAAKTAWAEQESRVR